MDIKAFQEEVRSLSEQLDTATPERRMLYLMSEVGELSNDIIDLLAIDPNAPDVAIGKIKERIGLEIYDVVWNAVDLANILEIDLEAAFQKKHDINKKRKWSRSGNLGKED